MTFYVFWSKFILVELIPYVTILVLNCAIIYKIFKAAHFRKRFTEDGGALNEENQLASKAGRNRLHGDLFFLVGKQSMTW